LRISDFDAYVELVEQEDHPEASAFINALTTNVTEFFRENHHFEALKTQLLPEIWKRHAQDRRVRIWSAGCSTGEEPYSIATVVREHMGDESAWDVKILATDIDSDVLAHAQAGVYASDKVERVGKGRLHKYFQVGAGNNAGKVRARESLRSLITFKQLNLMGAWPMRGPFDLIFCRNVIIYFDTPTRDRLVRGYRDLLVDNGVLFLGHAESLVSSDHAFEICGKTMYRKTGTP